MNEQARAWVDALRSGKFRQGKSLLKFRYEGDTEPRFCCWGVLCEIANVPQQSELRPGINEFSQQVWRFNDETELPDNDVIASVGIEQEDASYLAELNDNGTDFPAIADYIETLLA